MRVRGYDAEHHLLSGVKVRVLWSDGSVIVSGVTKSQILVQSSGFGLKFFRQLFYRLPPRFDFTPPPGFDKILVEAMYGGEKVSQEVAAPRDLDFQFSTIAASSKWRLTPTKGLASLTALTVLGLILYCFWPMPTSLQGDTGKFIGGSHPEKPYVVVFVHGIFGTADATWANGSNSLPKLLSEDPSFSKSTDVFLYEYYTPRYKNAAMIPELADQFNGMLNTNHIWGKQKVVFVAHSMGGLVVRQSLIAHREHASQIALMYFYATPTNGSEITIIAKSLSSNKQLQDMLPIEGNAFLSSVSSNWNGATELKQIPTSCAYEILKTGPILIVPRSSATALCNGEINPMTADHIGIVKPVDRHDQRYELLAYALSQVLIQPKSVQTTDILQVDK